MTITVDVTPEVQAELARQAAAHGRPIEAYAAGLLEEAAQLSAAPVGKDVAEAIERLRAFGKTHGLSLGGTTIRELRHEARP
jgi:PIN domain nuclease of toxin-antitoxin system